MLMAVGSFTIVAAVMMALVQHDLKRLLGYHAVSQVGYMVLGIGTGNPIGIAGGIFHMLNHAIYKSCLFLSAGAVEKRTGTSDLDKLGGLAKVMPVTFLTFMIASFAISGVPPFNGFASKWVIYQGVIENGKSGGVLWIVWLIAAMFGSALTLASFMKLLHAVFLGQPSVELAEEKNAKEKTSFAMLIPMVTLAALCILFGVLAYRIPLKMFILPSLKSGVVFEGFWHSGPATLMIIAGLVAGVVIYLLGLSAKSRVTDAFVGGENLATHKEMRMSGTEFYNTIQDVEGLKPIYSMAEKKSFDIYEVGTKITLWFTGILKYLHNGILPTYLAWCLIGTLVLFYLLLR
jgi:formate hydrogenlyase subunit 3/multisubunit Na+/H+ antiporter MnhD subunit